jgi:hypothetical protein
MVNAIPLLLWGRFANGTALLHANPPKLPEVRSPFAAVRFARSLSLLPEENGTWGSREQSVMRLTLSPISVRHYA